MQDHIHIPADYEDHIHQPAWNEPCRPVRASKPPRATKETFHAEDSEPLRDWLARNPQAEDQEG